MLKQAEALNSLTSSGEFPLSTFNGHERRLAALEAEGLILLLLQPVQP